MKRKIIMSSIVAICTSLYFVGSLKAQDTVKVKETRTTDTVRKQTTIVHDTVKKTPTVVHDTVKTVEPKKEENHLCRGEFGLRFMPTFTSLMLNTSNGGTVQGTASMSFGYGIMLGLNFTKNIGIQGELNYENISQKYKDQGLEREVHINYVNVPVLLSLNTNKTSIVNLNVVFGPQFGINVGSSITGSGTTTNTTTVQAVVAVKQGDVGFAYGAGFDIALGAARTLHLNLGFRGVYGLVDISGNSKDENTYNVLVHASRKSYAGYVGLTFCF